MDYHMTNQVISKARKIKLLLTDIDGVWTDTGVYYSARGEELKRFSIRDGMGVERLRELVGVETGIITGENSAAVVKRAEKLGIGEVHLNVRHKASVINAIMEKRLFTPEEVAYIGDDTNDLEALSIVGLSACPADAVSAVREVVDHVCERAGGHGAFRDCAELIILSKKEETT